MSLVRRMLILCSLLLVGALAPTQARAACTFSSGSAVYTWTAATVQQEALLNITGEWTCRTGNILDPRTSNPWLCAKLEMNGTTTAVSGITLSWQVSGSVGGLILENPARSGIWYGPGPSSPSGGRIPVSLTIRVPAGSWGPAGTYEGSLRLSVDMQYYRNAGVCESAVGAGGGWDAGTAVVRFSLVMPALCSLDTGAVLDFGSLAPAGELSASQDAEASLSATCNPGLPWALYLGDGEDRQPGSWRQMHNGTDTLPYQLYRDAARQQVWDGQNGVTQVGTGSSQSVTVYGRIPSGFPLPVTPGQYRDHVVVTMTY